MEKRRKISIRSSQELIAFWLPYIINANFSWEQEWLCFQGDSLSLLSPSFLLEHPLWHCITLRKICHLWKLYDFPSRNKMKMRNHIMQQGWRVFISYFPNIAQSGNILHPYLMLCFGYDFLSKLQNIDQEQYMSICKEHNYVWICVCKGRC